MEEAMEEGVTVEAMVVTVRTQVTALERVHIQARDLHRVQAQIEIATETVTEEVVRKKPRRSERTMVEPVETLGAAIITTIKDHVRFVFGQALSYERVQEVSKEPLSVV
jgi:hypothetical protein